MRTPSINPAHCTQKAEFLQAGNWWDKTVFHHTSLVPLHYCTSGRDSSHTQVSLKEKERTTKNNQSNKQQAWVPLSCLPPFYFPVHPLSPMDLKFLTQGKVKMAYKCMSLLLRSSIFWTQSLLITTYPLPSLCHCYSFQIKCNTLLPPESFLIVHNALDDWAHGDSVDELVSHWGQRRVEMNLQTKSWGNGTDHIFALKKK